MSNIYPPDAIPSLEEERPILNFNGFVFKNPAYHARHDDLWPPQAGVEGPKPEWRAAIDLYLGNFCRPIRNIANQVSCVACNALLVKPQGVKDPGKLTYDPNSEFGEGRCLGCGYPLRVGHLIWELPSHGKELLVKLDFFPLCYHPKALISGGERERRMQYH